MTYAAYDEDDYLGDVASIGGWTSFFDWAHEHGDAVADLVDSGYTRNPEALADQLKNIWAIDPAVESIRRNLLEIARKAKGILIVTDGVG